MENRETGQFIRGAPPRELCDLGYREQIALLTRKLVIARTALKNIGKCEASMNGHLARTALEQLEDSNG